MKSILAVMDASGELLLDIIVKILDITRIESGKFEKEISSFNLIDLVEGVVDTVSGIAEKKKLDIFMKSELVDYGYDVEGSQTHLKQILTNVYFYLLFIFYFLPFFLSFFFLKQMIK